jgi:hypothetical protein
MTTLAIMKARIASELARSNLTTQIANAISTAISVYQKERFRFNETLPLAARTFTTVAGQPYYSGGAPTITPVTWLPNLQKIDYLNILIGNTVQQLTRADPESLRLLNFANTQSGQPISWALEGETIILYPTPSAAYPITIGAFFQYPEPADDAETGNRWMLDGELLIRSRAKYEIALHVTRNEMMQKAMSPYPPTGGNEGHAAYWAWKDLKGEANRLTGLGRIRSTQF